MVEKDWNLSAAELDVLATDEPFMDKASEIVDLTDDEMALIEGPRHADVWADTAVSCLELPLEDLARFRATHPAAGERIARDLAAILARRLIAANNKIDLLTGH